MERRSVLFVTLCLVCAQALALPTNQTAAPVVPAIIIFGDSIVDPGNNNVIKTIVKCNFPPYGKDFDGQKPTGRFCNGKIPGDFIASRLGLKELLPAYLDQDLQADDLLTGVSFASGANGYDPLTSIITSVLSLPDQLNLFAEYKEKLRSVVGEARARSIVAQSLYLVCTGSDDLANTYFSTPFRSAHYDVPSYVNLMVAYASDFLQKLQQLGARKIGFVGLPPIGCLPSQRTLGGGLLRECVAKRNEAASLFNSKINVEIKRLGATLQDTKIVYLDIYNILLDLVQRPSFYGFEVSNKGCCGTGALEVSVLCNKKSPTCPDATKYVFWDSYHPTERAYSIIIDNLLEKYISLLV